MSFSMDTFPFFSGGGEMGARIRMHDWAGSPLGLPDTWSQSLQTLVSVLLGSKQAMFIVWGDAHTLLYNDAYAEILAQKHPEALGRPFLEVWSEIRDGLIPIVEQAYAGESVHMDDIKLIMRRRGYLEETHFAFSYTPIRNDLGQVAGFFCPCIETTAQIMAERSLIETTQRQRRLFEQAPGFIAILQGPQHVFEFTNAAYSKLFGPRSYEGKTVRQAFPELEGQGYFEWLDTVYQSGQRFVASNTPILLHHPNAEPDERWLDFIYEPISDNGHISGIFVEGYDVTEAYRAQEARRLSERQFRALAQSMPSMAWSAEPDGQLTWFNEQVHEYSGFSQQELINDGWTQIVHPDDLPLALQKWEASLTSVSPYSIEFRLRDRDGNFRWHESKAVPVLDDHGKVSLWVGSNTDIHDRKLSEDTLRALNETLEQRVEERTAERDRVWKNSQDLLAVLNPEGFFRSVNPAWKSILGYELEEIEGRHLSDFVWPEDIELTSTIHEQFVAESTLTHFENRYRHKDGSVRWISWYGSVEGDMVYGYGRDITVEKAQAETLARTEALLRQSQKMEAVGQLTGGLAHDFNNLLTGITGSLDIIQTRIKQGRLEDVDRYINAAQSSAKRAAALTHRLLAFSRRQTLDATPTDINRLVAGMEDMVRRTIGPAIELEITPDNSLWPVLTDQNQLENALLNLCINARDAMPGGGRLTVKTANRWLDDPTAHEFDVLAGQYASLLVSDNGSGMTPDVVAKAFDPFFTTKPIGMGTGLGLSMIYGFVRQSGGHVSIYSEVGKGTEVSLYLPRHQAAFKENVEHPIELGETPRARSGETVLIVDDEPTVRMLIVEILTELGYSTIEADEATSGLKVLNTNAEIDLLITDVGLPGMNGRQMADAARVKRPELKVLFITGYAETAVMGNGQLEAGMYIMTKPFDMVALGVRIKEIIELDRLS